MNWVKIVVVILVKLVVILSGLSYRTLYFDYGNDRFMETKGKQLEFKESVYNMEDGSEIAYL
ncbi:MAG TPA: hypothetical protein K8V19_07610 [Globicatella sulfidifaciens]|nr:hypothetical protein [Globicatella sulfidifaciens]